VLSSHGELIKKARLEKGYTLRQLAEKIGFSHDYIHGIEKGRQRGSFQILVKLAEALDIPKESLLDQVGLLIKEKDKFYSPSIEDLEFSRLEPKLKRALLDLAPAIKKNFIE
jgi:transcriptional regulator with XRE-family HTH domain